MITVHLTVTGIVQGVGFRPFLHRLAEKHSVNGWVRNTSEGLEGILKGSDTDIDAFLYDLENTAPPLSSIESVDTAPADDADIPPGFTIKESRSGSGHTLVSPDIATCPECASELSDPSDRRYRYPFINCTNCGPRYTIIRALPYDRANTVMERFKMCDECDSEYHDIRDRRYHAEPDCCPECGPEVFFIAGKSDDMPDIRTYDDPFRSAQELLARGGILAVKGVGGIHLACDALKSDAVMRLRRRKGRAEKPLALMCADQDAAKRICDITAEEERILTDPARPIVLLAKKDRDSLHELSFSPRLGVMLPYTPLHMLLLDKKYGGPDILVMTSGNITGCPVLTDNDEALQALSDVADGFLLHDRPIENRCDDSLVMEWRGGPYFFRKSRGYIPKPLKYDREVDGIFAMGAELKASFAMGREKDIFLSPYIGDLKNAETMLHYRNAYDVYRRLFRTVPRIFVCDLHPDYMSTQTAVSLAKESETPLLKVQHHFAHMASCMADNSLDLRCFGVIWDGTGLGTDGLIWGGEFLEGDLTSFRRRGSVRPVSLIGGDRAVDEISRTALALLRDSESEHPDILPIPHEKRDMLARVMDSGICPLSSGIGRLFDGAASLILSRSEADYDGEAPALVEALSPSETPESASSLHELSYTVSFYTEKKEDGDVRIFDTRPMIREMAGDIAAGKDRALTASRFMSTLCVMALDQCMSLNTERLPVVLSGGVFQNRFLLSGITMLLEENGFDVYTHRQVSPGDEGICLGQLAVARAILDKDDDINEKE